MRLFKLRADWLISDIWLAGSNSAWMLTIGKQHIKDSCKGDYATRGLFWFFHTWKPRIQNIALLAGQTFNSTRLNFICVYSKHVAKFYWDKCMNGKLHHRYFCILVRTVRNLIHRVLQKIQQSMLGLGGGMKCGISLELYAPEVALDVKLPRSTLNQWSSLILIRDGGWLWGNSFQFTDVERAKRKTPVGRYISKF